MRLLMISLTITPARRLFNQPNLIVFRRMLGLFAFFYGVLHLTTWLWLDKFFDPREMLADLTKRRFIMMGMFAFLLLVPLAVTSTKGWIRRLGKNWGKLHRLVYVSTLAGVIHYWMLDKSDIRLPAYYGLVVAILLAFRLYRARMPAGHAPARRAAERGVGEAIQ